MTAFVARHMEPLRGQSQSVLDLGSYNVNGCYRPLFDDPQWSYIGVDMEAGPNVDLVPANPYRLRELKSGSQSVVISGQAFEHIEFFWVTFQEMVRLLQPGGLICILAPSRGYEHRYPVDCWRFYPDSFAALARYAGVELLEANTQWQPQGYTDGSDEWGDSMAVFRRPLKMSYKRLMLNFLRRRIDAIALGVK